MKAFSTLLRSSRGTLQATLRPILGASLRSASYMAKPTSDFYPNDLNMPITEELKFLNPADMPRIPVYRVMNEDGTIRPGQEVPARYQDKEAVLEAYKCMVKLENLDKVFYDAQRQGRISFYMQNAGEEGIHIGSASALADDDEIFAQYREAGVLMWRGFQLQQFADQCFSNESDLGKGRQMPVHYGTSALHFHTISSPLATQLPQAAGAAYALKRANANRIAVCYFGEGAASEGDFHAGLNFAATLEAPIIFFCRNNGYAISTPTRDQFRGDGIASRAPGYGMRTIRVDGNDIWAVYNATAEARKIALEENCPILIEAMTYREGHHSTSDDSTRYRDPEEITRWRSNGNPVRRLKAYMESKGWWSDEEDKELHKALRKDVLTALVTAEKKSKPHRDELFTDVYDTIPKHLQRQKQELEEHLAKYPDQYDLNAH